MSRQENTTVCGARMLVYPLGSGEPPRPCKRKPVVCYLWNGFAFCEEHVHAELAEPVASKLQGLFDMADDDETKKETDR